MTCLTSGVSHSKNVSHALKKIDPIAPNEIFLYGPSCIACTHRLLLFVSAPDQSSVVARSYFLPPKKRARLYQSGRRKRRDKVQQVYD